jgi:arylsulfatase A-like enzyme
MMIRLLAMLVFLGAASGGLQAAPLASKRPNIILIVTDDQGYGDISAHGNPVLKTPNLDRLHSESVRFVDFHVSPTCAPTRSALMTGRHEFKNGITHTIYERERMTLEATTLADLLRSGGYATGIFGKWHLGDEPAYRPDRRGFDETFIHGGGGIGQMYPGSCGDAPGNTYFNPFILHNGKFEKTTGYCTDVFFQRATDWMNERRQARKPFFAYIATNAPHAPLHAKPEDKALYEKDGLSDAVASFFGMIHNIDQNIGTLLSRLQEWGIERDTLLVFMNDNGSTAGSRVFNAGMRGTKATSWMGGTRAASFWRWPRVVAAGDCRVLSAHVDVLPTLTEIAGVALPANVQKQVEGRSLVRLLENPAAEMEDRVLITHVGRWGYHEDPQSAKFSKCSVRNTRWHLVSEKGTVTPQWQLFDVSRDYQESTDVSADNPEIVKMLAEKFENFWTEAVPLMVNEKVTGPAINPFSEKYHQQFGTKASEADLRRMSLKNRE